MTTPFNAFIAALPFLAAFSVVASGAAQTSGTASPHADPPLSALLDSAGLARAVASLTVRPDRVPPLFRVTFDSTGAARSVEPLIDRLPAAYAEPVAAAIRAHLKPQSPPRVPLEFYLRVVAGQDARVDVPTLRERAPELGNRTEVGRLLNEVIASRRGSWQREQYGGTLKMRVLSDGTVDLPSVQLIRSTGDAGLDSAAVRVAGEMRFTPAAVENFPIRVWVTLPIGFETRYASSVRGFNSPSLDVLFWMFLYSHRSRLDTVAVEPPFSAVVDSAALARALAALPAASPHVRPVFRVRFDTAGAVEEVEPVFAEMPATDAAPLVAAIRAHLNPRGPLKGRRHTYLQVVAGPEPRVERLALAERQPVLVNPEAIALSLSEAARRHPPRGTPPVMASYTLRVLRDGAVDPASIITVRSADDQQLDRAAMAVLQRMQFRPGLIDGTAVDMWLQVPVIFRFVR